MVKRILPPVSALMLLALWCTDTNGLFPCFAAAAAMHEIGHLAAMKLLGAKKAKLRLSIPGFVIEYSGTLSYGRDALVALAGPAANILLALILSPLAARGQLAENTYVYSGANIMLALFNLLPAEPLDGGKALYSLLCLRFSPDTAHNTVDILTFIVSLTMFFAGLYILLQTRYNITMLASSGLMIGGLYAKRFGKSPAKGPEARTLRRGRIRSDKKRP